MSSGMPWQPVEGPLVPLDICFPSPHPPNAGARKIEEWTRHCLCVMGVFCVAAAFICETGGWVAQGSIVSRNGSHISSMMKWDPWEL